MVPTTLRLMASSHRFLAPAKTDHFPLHYRSVSFPKQVHNVGSGFVASPSPCRPRSGISFVVVSSIQAYQSSGQQDRHFRSSNFSPWKNESVLGTLPQRTSKAVRKAGDGGNGSDSEEDLFTRRLVILSHDVDSTSLLGRMLGRTPSPREDVIKILLHNLWRPQYCFVRDSPPPEETWEHMKNFKENHGNIVPWKETVKYELPPDFHIKQFETTFGDYLGELNEEVKTIMMMTIGTKKDFQGLVKHLSPKSNIGFGYGPPYVAMFGTMRGDSWDKEQTLVKGQWNLVYSQQGASPNTVSDKRKRTDDTTQSPGYKKGKTV